MRHVSRALVGLLATTLIVSGSASVGTPVWASSPVDPLSEGSSPAHQVAQGAAVPQPPTGTVVGTAAPTPPTPQTVLPSLAAEDPQPLDLNDMPVYPPTTVGGFDPSTSVELPSERTVDTTVFLNANGTRTAFAYNGAIHYKDALGMWQNVDQALELDRVAGTYHPKAVGVGLALASNTANLGSLAALTVDSGHSVGYRIDGAASATALVNGATAKYANVLPATDLELVALADGVKETLVLKSTSAPTSFTFPLTLNGVSASVDANGDVVYADGAGVEWARTPRGSMVDAFTNMDSGEGAFSDGVTYAIVPYGSGVAIRMTLDSAWLNDPARRFPVRVDPTTVTKLTDSDDTYVQNGYSANNSTETLLKIGTPDSTPHTTYSYLHFGGINSTYNNYFVSGAELDLVETHSWTCTPKSWTVHNVTAPWSGSTITASTAGGHAGQPSFDPTPVKTMTTAEGDTCGGIAWDAVDIKSAVQNWTHGTANYGLTVRPGSATDVNYWKKFASYQDDPTNHASAPRIKFSYSTQGAKYAPVGWQLMPTNTTNGKFRITVTNWGHDAWPANGSSYKLAYHLYDSAGQLITFDGVRTAMPTTVNPRQSITLDATVGKLKPGSYRIVWDMVQESVTWFSQAGVPPSPATGSYTFSVTNQAPAISKVNSPADLAAVTTNRPTLSVTAADTDNYPGGALSYYFRICTGTDAESGTCTNSGWISTSSWTPPASTLYWRKQYYWHAYVKDSGGAQRNPSWVWRFTPVVSDTSAGAHRGADPYGINDGGVNVSIGDYVTSAVEAPVATIGPPLSVTRTYNSGDSRVGAFGVGWSSLYDMSATADASGNVTVVHADGRRALYGKNPDGTYVASFGFYSTLAAVTGGGWTLTDKGANVYTFSAAGKLVNVKDPAGLQITLATDGAGNTVVTDVTSGRTLTLAWTGTHVTSAATASVAAAGGPLVWRYTYTGDNLTSACDPRSKCVTYAYSGTGGRLSSVTLARGNTPEVIHYASDGTVDYRQDGRGKQWTYTRVAELVDPANGMRITVLDPRNNTTVYLYDSQGRLVRRQDGYSATRSFGYDTATGFLSSITDENGNTLTLTVDDRGNVLSRSVPYGDVAGLVATSYYSYIYEPGSPRDNKINVYRDGRSANANDSTYAVSYVYSSSNGQITTLSTPPTATFPSGTSATWTYTTGSEAAVGSTGTQPAGLLKTETDPRGFATSYSYNSRGDLTRVVDREGLRTDYGYDEIGRLATETTYPTGYPAGLATTYGYDLSGVLAVVTGPGVLDPRTNVTHTQRTTYTPDANGIIRDTTVTDLTGGDVTHTTHIDVDGNDNVTLVRDPEGGTTTRTYDDAENIATVTDPRGQLTQFDYDQNNRVKTVTAKSFVDDPITPGSPHDVVLATYSYDGAGRLASTTDARSVQRRYAWYGDDRLQSVTVAGYHNPDNTTRDLVTEWHRYDAAGNEIVTKLGGYLRTVNSTYNEAGWLATQTEDPATLNRVTTFLRDQAGNPTTVRRDQVSDSAPSEETRYGYDNGGNVTSATVENGATDLLTAITRDNRGQVTGSYDPRGTTATPYNATYLTSYNYDGLGRLLDVTGAQVTAEEGGTSPTSGRAQWLFGYDTFGERTRVVDPRGKTYVTTYDKAGRPKVVTWPSYTPPGGSAMIPTETYGYNAAGDLTSLVDRRGNTTTFDYDTLGRLVRRTQPKPDAAQANPVNRWTYDPNGNLASAVDATQARTEYVFDDLNRLQKVTNVVRPTPSRYTTTYGYDDLGNLNKRVEPRGETSYADYNADGELIQVQDGAGSLWKFGRDVAGRVTRRTDPIGRYQTTTFDLAGRATSLAAYNPANTLLHTENATYDAAGNLASHTPSASGPGVTTAATRTYAFDPANQLTSLTEPTTTTHNVVTSFGYDLAGNRTRITDGLGHATTTSFNAWELPETVTEPSTTAYPALADRTWTTSYNAAGLATNVAKPGGVSVASTYDALGRLTAETGAGAAGTRSLGYDLVGRLTTAGHPSGTETFGYDDRGLLTSSNGPAGTVTNTYDEDGRLTSRADAAGTTSFTYDQRGLPATITDPLTGKTQTIAYWPDGQIKSRQWGANAGTRNYTYNDQGRLATDTSLSSAGATTAAYSYTYDGDGNLATRTIAGSGINGAGTHTYGYDLADRLTTWTGPGGTKTYGYDDAGNRTTAAGTTYTYDERNRLLTDTAGGAYTYTARGTLARTAAGGNPQFALTADAFDRIVTDTGTNFTYDSLDRVATAGTTGYSYDGTDPEPVAVGTSKVARDPAGQLVATNLGAAGSAVVANPHGDVNALVDPATGAANGSRSYDPFGVATTSGTANALGFQGQVTSSAGRVHMQARSYDPTTATFTGRDTYAMSAPRAGGANRYGYALGNPATLADPTGHCANPADCAPVAGAGLTLVAGGAAATVTCPVWCAVAAGAAIGAGAYWVGNKIWGSDGKQAQPSAGTASAPIYGPFAYDPYDWRNDTPHGHYQGNYGSDPTEPAHGHPAPQFHPQPPVPHIPGPPPANGPGAFKPITIDPLEQAIHLAEAAAPAPAPVTGPTADDRPGTCGHGGVVSTCAPKRTAAVTRGCHLGTASAMTNCEPVTPKNQVGRGDDNATPRADDCDDTVSVVDPHCGPYTGGAANDMYEYPPNDGFLDDPVTTTLEQGTRIDRYGRLSGRYASPEGTPFGARSLPSAAQRDLYTVLEVVQPVDVQAGIARPWFGQTGYGVQYKFFTSITELVDSGVLKVIGP